MVHIFRSDRLKDRNLIMLILALLIISFFFLSLSLYETREYKQYHSYTESCINCNNPPNAYIPYIEIALYNSISLSIILLFAFAWKSDDKIK